MDDNESFLEASRTLLNGQGLSVVGIATTAADGVRLATELRPDVVLVDIDLGRESGFEVACRMVGEAVACTAGVILISTHVEDDYADLVAESPALGFVAKQDLSKQAIETVLRRRGASDATGPR
ncbi:MAG TPA: response regulator transcription factor [Candidatus Dormibacteraeota bacterium]|nr:response regulator transcription factor [Candidatus Dormibacteraeota bacterium]